MLCVRARARARVCVCTEVVIYILTKRNTVDLEPCGRETQRARVMNVRLCQPDLVADLLERPPSIRSHGLAFSADANRYLSARRRKEVMATVVKTEDEGWEGF